MDIFINPPKEIHVTQEEFKNFNYFELAAFFMNYKACLSVNDNKTIRLWTSRYELAQTCLNNYRFKDIEWYEIEEVELYHCDIPEGELNKLIKKHFKHLFLK